jgi:hypothetical protein
MPDKVPAPTPEAREAAQEGLDLYLQACDALEPNTGGSAKRSALLKSINAALAAAEQRGAAGEREAIANEMLRRADELYAKRRWAGALALNEHAATLRAVRKNEGDE